MAKSRTNGDEEIIPVQTFGADGKSDDLEAARKRVAELEAQLAAATKTKDEATAEAAADAAGKFLVKVQNGPAYVVAANSQYHAISVYQSVSGMVQMGYTPEVKPVPDDTPEGPYKG